MFPSRKAHALPITLSIPLAAIMFASPALADDDTILDLTLAGVVAAGPDYEGSDDYDLDILPYVELSAFGGLVSLSFDGAEAFLPLGDDFAVGAGLGYEGGRDEDDNDALDGLGDIDDSVIGSVSAIAVVGDTELGLTFAHALGGDVEGYTIDLTLGHEIEVIDDRFDIEFDARVTWASKDYLDTYFGIDAGQAAASGLDETDVDAGIKNAGLAITGNYYPTDGFVLGLALDYRRLLDDAADSPIVSDEGSPDQLSAMAYLAVEIGLF